MSIDVLKSYMVPKHEKMSPQERNELLDRLGIEKEKLPKILESDPVAKKLGVKKGDVLKITRSSPTSGDTTYYRLVVA